MVVHYNRVQLPISRLALRPLTGSVAETMDPNRRDSINENRKEKCSTPPSHIVMPIATVLMLVPRKAYAQMAPTFLMKLRVSHFARKVSMKYWRWMQQKNQIWQRFYST